MRNKLLRVVVIVVSLLYLSVSYVEAKEIKVFVLIFDPFIDSEGKKLTELKSWNDPTMLNNQFITDVNEVSNGYVNYTIVESIEVDNIPEKINGDNYTDDSYIDCLADTSTCHPDTAQGNPVNYVKVLNDFNICERRNAGEIDELWLWGGPYFGYWEAVMAGPGAFNTNAPPINGTSCQRQLNIMGFNYERGVASMLEDMGHRVEGTLRHFYGGWTYRYGPPPLSKPISLSPFDQYTARGFDVGVVAGCGNIHGSLNTPVYDSNNYYGYDWVNQNVETSNCEDWQNYPFLTGVVEELDCTSWGCNKYSGRKWWLDHIPYDWWRYVADYENAILSFRISELQFLLLNYLSSADFPYFPMDGKVNSFDLLYVLNNLE